MSFVVERSRVGVKVQLRHDINIIIIKKLIQPIRAQQTIITYIDRKMSKVYIKRVVDQSLEKYKVCGHIIKLMEHNFNETGSPPPKKTSFSSRPNNQPMLPEQIEPHIHRLNQYGLQLGRSHKYAQALECFRECQRVLQSGAQWGLCIDRQLIIAVLNNEAASLQLLGQAEQALNYVQAIIFQIDSFLKEHEIVQLRTIIMAEGLTQLNFLNEPKAEMAGVLVMRLQQYGTYLLKFSGLQMIYGHYQQAISSARKAISAIKQLFVLCQRLQRLKQVQIGSISQLLSELVQLPQQFQPKQLQSYLLEYKSLQQSSRLKMSLSQRIGHSSRRQQITKKTLSDHFSLQYRSCQSTSQPLMDRLDYCFYVQRVQVAACMYFALSSTILKNNQHQKQLQQSCIYLFGSAQIRRRQRKDNLLKAQLCHVYSLLLCKKHLPFPTQTITELTQLYEQTQTDNQSQMSISIAEKLQESLVLQTKSVRKKEQQTILLQGRNEGESVGSALMAGPSTEQSLQNMQMVMQSIEQMQRKYEPYLLQKEIDFEESLINDFEQPPGHAQQQLFQLFKKEPPKKQQQYIQDLPSIDSFQMTTSLTNAKNSPVKSKSVEDVNIYELPTRFIDHMNPKQMRLFESIRMQKPGQGLMTPKQLSELQIKKSPSFLQEFEKLPLQKETQKQKSQPKNFKKAIQNRSKKLTESKQISNQKIIGSQNKGPKNSISKNKLKTSEAFKAQGKKGIQQSQQVMKSTSKGLIQTLKMNKVKSPRQGSMMSGCLEGMVISKKGKSKANNRSIQKQNKSLQKNSKSLKKSSKSKQSLSRKKEWNRPLSRNKITTSVYYHK